MTLAHCVIPMHTLPAQPLGSLDVPPPISAEPSDASFCLGKLLSRPRNGWDHAWPTILHKEPYTMGPGFSEAKKLC
jgi:hypothetical protein